MGLQEKRQSSPITQKIIYFLRKVKKKGTFVNLLAMQDVRKKSFDYLTPREGGGGAQWAST